MRIVASIRDGASTRLDIAGKPNLNVPWMVGCATVALEPPCVDAGALPRAAYRREMTKFDTRDGQRPY